MERALVHASRMGTQVARLSSHHKLIDALNIERAFFTYRSQFEGSNRDQVTSAYYGALWGMMDTLIGYKIEHLTRIIEVDAHPVMVSTLEAPPEFEKCSRQWEFKYPN